MDFSEILENFSAALEEMIVKQSKMWKALTAIKFGKSL